MGSREFTRNWTRRYADTWRRHMLPLAGGADHGTWLLEIGVFEARSARWFLDNFLQHETDRYVGIDPWELDAMSARRFPRNGPGEQRIRDVEERARRNLAPFGEKAVLIKGRSAEVLIDPAWAYLFRPATFSVAYVDGVHKTRAVYRDAELVWPLVRPGGLVIFDDYRQSGRRRNHVKEGVDRFLTEAVPDEFEEVWCGRQVGVRKL